MDNQLHCHAVHTLHYVVTLGWGNGWLTRQQAEDIKNVLASDERTAGIGLDTRYMYQETCSNCGEYFSIRAYRYNDHRCSHCDAKIDFGGPSGTPTVERIEWNPLDSPRGK